MLFLPGIDIARDIVLAIHELQLRPGFLVTFFDAVIAPGQKGAGRRAY